MDINYVWNVFFGQPPPPIPNMRMGLDEVLPFHGLVRGTLVIGKPGVGKTRYCAWFVIQYMLAFPDRGILILDASGALKKDILAITLLLSEEKRKIIWSRLIIDIPFQGEHVHTMPEFHLDYDVTFEKQVQRVAENLRRLNQKTMDLAMLGKPSFEEMAPELFRLLCAIRNEAGETWQLTEAKKLLTDGSQLTIALNQFGGQVPEAKGYFDQFKQLRVDEKEREMRSYTLRSALGVIEPRDIRARLGGTKPSWTIEEVDRKGLCAIVSGERMLDQEPQMNYIFTQMYSMLKQEMNKRLPDDPKEKPFLLMIDEAPVMYRVPGMAQELGELSTFYRNRKLQLVIIIQALWQVTKELQGQLWSLGNKVVFSVEDMDDAETIAEHLFYYASTMIKQPPRSPYQNPTTEPDHGQYHLYANWLNSLPQRACVVRRYQNQSQPDPYVRYYSRIGNIKASENWQEIAQLSEWIFKSRAVPIKDALAVINKRNLSQTKAAPVTPRQQDA